MLIWRRHYFQKQKVILLSNLFFTNGSHLEKQKINKFENVLLLLADDIQRIVFVKITRILFVIHNHCQSIRQNTNNSSLSNALYTLFTHEHEVNQLTEQLYPSSKHYGLIKKYESHQELGKSWNICGPLSCFSTNIGSNVSNLGSKAKKICSTTNSKTRGQISCTTNITCGIANCRNNHSYEDISFKVYSNNKRSVLSNKRLVQEDSYSKDTKLTAIAKSFFKNTNNICDRKSKHILLYPETTKNPSFYYIIVSTKESNIIWIGTGLNKNYAYKQNSGIMSTVKSTIPDMQHQSSQNKSSNLSADALFKVYNQNNYFFQGRQIEKPTSKLLSRKLMDGSYYYKHFIKQNSSLLSIEKSQNKPPKTCSGTDFQHNFGFLSNRQQNNSNISKETQLEESFAFRSRLLNSSNKSNPSYGAQFKQFFTSKKSDRSDVIENSQFLNPNQQSDNSRANPGQRYRNKMPNKPQESKQNQISTLPNNSRVPKNTSAPNGESFNLDNKKGNNGTFTPYQLRSIYGAKKANDMLNKKTSTNGEVLQLDQKDPKTISKYYKARIVHPENQSIFVTEKPSNQFGREFTQRTLMFSKFDPARSASFNEDKPMGKNIVSNPNRENQSFHLKTYKKLSEVDYVRSSTNKREVRKTNVRPKSFFGTKQIPDKFQEKKNSMKQSLYQEHRVHQDEAESPSGTRGTSIILDYYKDIPDKDRYTQVTEINTNIFGRPFFQRTTMFSKYDPAKIAKSRKQISEQTEIINEPLNEKCEEDDVKPTGEKMYEIFSEERGSPSPVSTKSKLISSSHINPKIVLTSKESDQKIKIRSCPCC